MNTVSSTFRRSDSPQVRRRRVADAAGVLRARSASSKLSWFKAAVGKTKMAFQVYPHHLVPVVLAEADEHAVTQAAGVVNQHMHFAESGHGGIDDGLRAVHCGDVSMVGKGTAARGSHFGGDSFGRFEPDVVDHDVSALGRESQRIGAAQAAAGAGDDDSALITKGHGA